MVFGRDRLSDPHNWISFGAFGVSSKKVCDELIRLKRDYIELCCKCIGFNTAIRITSLIARKVFEGSSTDLT